MKQFWIRDAHGLYRATELYLQKDRNLNGVFHKHADVGREDLVLP